MDIFIKLFRSPACGTSIPYWRIYLVSIVFSFHTLITAYSSSTYLERFVTPESVGLLYAAGSALSLVLFLSLPRILSYLGTTPTTMILGGLSITALFCLGAAVIPVYAFILFTALNPLLYLTIDIYSENTIGVQEGETGQKRGLALSLMSLASVCAPLLMGIIVGENDQNLHHTYYYAAGVGMAFLLLVVIFFRSFCDPLYERIPLRKLFSGFTHNREIRLVVLAHFVLQFFFSWAVIYFPLYLATEVGLSWGEIGTIIAFGLFAYVIFEYPIGLLADKKWGEKEMMALGFAVLALTSGSISYLAGASIAVWAGLTFLSRIGASLVEVTTESFFFKQVRSTDAAVISLFRLTRPLANLVGAATGSVVLLVLPFPSMFLLLGLIMLPGIGTAAAITDSR